MTEFYEALAQAKELVNERLSKKLGRNDFSRYDYFLPSQITNAVRETCKEVGLITMFDMEQMEDGRVRGILEVVHIKSGKGRAYTSPTAIPEIKATNAAQKIGGSITYSKRYLETAAFDIAEDDKDPDATHNTTVKKNPPVVKKVELKVVPAEKFPELLDWAVRKSLTAKAFVAMYKFTPVQNEQINEKLK